MVENSKPKLTKAEKFISPNGATNYQVLARKYRPHTFSGLIGQDVLVKILNSAFESGRIAHAFILSGIRGIGKTTTARIIARALNCLGPGGKSGPTIDPCGSCVNCEAIGEDRHMDVLEVDAASRTGVDDIREIIDSVSYLPTSARYKIYIIDEVHMLSKNAFNALLKTLEEPPPHVKFVFATTEIKKVPITVLSRCQRFDLSRVDAAELAGHFSKIISLEGAKVSNAALNLISKAADGSVRDGLSILDQAICQSSSEVDENIVREMLGLADRSQTFRLLQFVFSGDIKGVLELFDSHYKSGANPLSVFEDMLEIISLLTRIKITPDLTNDIALSEVEREAGSLMVEKISMAFLARAWQILLKGLGEMNAAPSIKQAADMVLIRLTYASDLPTPDEAIKFFSQGNGNDATNAEEKNLPGKEIKKKLSDVENNYLHLDKKELKISPETSEIFNAPPKSFQELVNLVEEKCQISLKDDLLNDIKVTHFEEGKIELSLSSNAAEDLIERLREFLNYNTEISWQVYQSSEQNNVCFVEKEESRSEKKLMDVEEMPLIRAVLDVFPGASIERASDIAVKQKY